MNKRAYTQALDALIACFSAGRKLLLCGNGGSAADCAHIVGELAKGFEKTRPLAEDVQAAIGEPWAQQLQRGCPIDLTPTRLISQSSTISTDRAYTRSRSWPTARPGMS